MLDALRNIAHKVRTTMIEQSDRDNFYNSMTWRNKRAEIMQRDNYECQVCKSQGKVTLATDDNILIVHHIEPLEYEPELKLDDDNLITVCIQCHNTIHYTSVSKRWDDEWWGEEE